MTLPVRLSPSVRPPVRPTGGGASGGGGGRRSAGLLVAVQAAAAQLDRLSVQAAQKGDSVSYWHRPIWLRGGPPGWVWVTPAEGERWERGGRRNWKAAPETLETHFLLLLLLLMSSIIKSMHYLRDASALCKVLRGVSPYSAAESNVTTAGHAGCIKILDSLGWDRNEWGRQEKYSWVSFEEKV